MTTMPATLKRETTRALCNEFTTLYDQTDSVLNISSSQEKVDIDANSSFSLSQTASQLATLDLNTISSFWGSQPSEQQENTSCYALPSPAASAVSPASTPYIDSEELLVVETLSPPASPWFPSAMDLGKCVPDDQDSVSAQQNNLKSNESNHESETNENTVTSSSHMEFFNNPFYESLSGAKYNERSHPYHSFQRQKSASVTSAVKSSNNNHVATENNGTAAPSDLFNVTIDEILSSDPLNFGDIDLSESESKTIKSELDTVTDTDVDFAISMIMAVAEQVVGCQSNSQDDGLATDVKAALRDQEREIFGADSSSQESALSLSDDDEDDDDDDGSDYEANSKQNPKKRVRTTKGQSKKANVAATQSPPSKRRSNPKAPRSRRKSAKKPPKVYPPRKPRSQDASHGIDSCSVDDNNQDCESSVECSKPAYIDVKNIGKDTATADDGFYRCTLCPSERFGRVHDLKRHQISKHNEKTWPCDFCSRPFVRRDALLRHYAVKAERRDGLHPTLQEANRLSEARARARLRV